MKVWDRLAHRQETLYDYQIPLEFRENHIKSGYRIPGKPWSYYIASLFQVHNDTINVWSHLIAVFLYLHYSYSYTSQLDFSKHPDAIGLLGFTFCVCMNVGLSSLAHLLQARSTYDHIVLFQYDYIGIGLFNQGVASLLYFCTGTARFHRHFGHTYLVGNVLFALLMFWVNCIAKLKYQRPYPPERKQMMMAAGVLQGVFMWIPLYYKLYDHYPFSELETWNYLIGWMCFGLAVASFALDQPEAAFPGWFDIIGHGHQWWHLFMILTTLSVFKIGYTDLLMKYPEDIPTQGTSGMVLAIVGFIALCLICQRAFIRPLTLSKVCATKHEKTG